MPNRNIRKSTVMLIDADYLDIQAGVDRVFASFPQNWPGKNVLVKPNMLGPYQPDKAVTTHPSLVRAVVRRLVTLGANVIVGDNPGHVGYGLSRQTADVTGIEDAAEGHYKNIGADSEKRTICGTEVLVSADVLKCDILISLPKFKTHMYTLMTGAVKNSYGILAGREKSRLHQLFWKPDEFSRAVAAVYAIRPPNLVIMDAIVGMEGDGPNSPLLRNVNKLLASDNGVALDVAVCLMMGLNANDVPVLREASLLGLGQLSLDDINIEGTLSKLPDFKLPVTYRTSDRIRQVVVDRILGRGKIYFDYDKCTGCLMCVNACPQKALRSDPEKHQGKPVIDHSLCILCFCCKEMCPHNAIRLSGLFNLFQRINNTITSRMNKTGSKGMPERH